MAGESIPFTLADIQATARAYDPRLSKAPIVIGHPATDDPAQGWAQSLAATERGLFAQPMKVDPAFAEAVNAGRYGTISAKFYRPQDAANPVPGVWYLRHIGFLGAQPPAVKGLDDPAFAADADDGCVCFQEGLAVAPDINFQPPKESTVTDEEVARLREENLAKDRRIAELEAKQRADEAATTQAANTAFAEQMASEARILPAWKPLVAAIGTQLQATPDVEFGEGVDKKPMVEVFRDFVRALPPAVSFGEQAARERAAAGQGDAGAGAGADDCVEFGEGVDPDRLKQHRAIQAYAKENKTSYATAARAVIK